jgi:hypothetical protein
MNHISADELRAVFAQVPALVSAEVTHPFPFIAPNTVDITGFVDINGERSYWEVSQFDLGRLKTRDDVERFLNMLLKSFKDASKNPEN